MENDFTSLPGVDVISVNKQGKFDLLCLFRVYRQILRWKPLIVQPFLTPATFFGLLPAIWSRVPVIIVTERNAGVRKDMGAGARLFLKMEDFFSRYADLAISNSEAGKQSLVQRGISPERIRTIYNGLNFQRLLTDKTQVQQVRQRYNIPPHIPVVGMMARFSLQKNHGAFFSLAALVNQMRPDVHFALLGDGPRRSEMEALCESLGLRQQTTFFGEHADVGPYLSTFDVMVLTSDAEGCSNSILEAMSLGKPVVATDVGGNREVIVPGETGFLVPRGDVNTAANRVIDLLHRTEKAREMGNRARGIVLSRFSLEKMVNEYSNVFETTLSQKISPKRRTLVRHER
jgi:glycosyltransferase involved in cell wall biosynthesis